MSFIKSMQHRYTTKRFDASAKISPEKKSELKEILRLSPSSINSQPWKFTFVESIKAKRQLSKVSWLNTNKVLDCDTLVVFSRINDISLFEKQIEEELPEGAVNYFKEFIKTQSDELIKSWFSRQLYLSLGIFLSACAVMDIDSTPMEGIESENYDKILGLSDYTTLAAVAIGYRDENDFNQPNKKPKTRRKLDRIIKSI